MKQKYLKLISYLENKLVDLYKVVKDSAILSSEIID